MASLLSSTSLCSSFCYHSTTHIASLRGCSQSIVFVTSPPWFASAVARTPSPSGRVSSAGPSLCITKSGNSLTLSRPRCQAVSFKLDNTTAEEVSELQFLQEDDFMQEAVNGASLQDMVNGASLHQTKENVDVDVKDGSNPVELKEDSEENTRVKTFKIWFSDVVVNRKYRPYWFRDWTVVDTKTAVGVAASHVLALFAPFTFSWNALAITFVLWVITGIGVTLSFHRNLSHRSFKVPKWLEYTFAYCGAHALQGDPSFWASAHRFHHQHCETERDPHSPTHGVWHSHMGWFVDRKVLTQKVPLFQNIPDMINDPFYKFIRNTYELHPLMLGFLMYKLGGFPYVVWCMGVRGVWTYHHTFFVNSVCHIWGGRKYKTNDFSRNNWWVSFFCFGEGWHNNHHAFPSAAQHGFDWWEIDPTWGIISFLEKIGLATEVKRTSKEAMARLALK